MAGRTVPLLSNLWLTVRDFSAGAVAIYLGVPRVYTTQRFCIIQRSSKCGLCAGLYAWRHLVHTIAAMSRADLLSLLRSLAWVFQKSINAITHGWLKLGGFVRSLVSLFSGGAASASGRISPDIIQLLFALQWPRLTGLEIITGEESRENYLPLYYINLQKTNKWK